MSIFWIVVVVLVVVVALPSDASLPDYDTLPSLSRSTSLASHDPPTAALLTTALLDATHLIHNENLTEGKSVTVPWKVVNPDDETWPYKDLGIPSPPAHSSLYKALQASLPPGSTLRLYRSAYYPDASFPQPERGFFTRRLTLDVESGYSPLEDSDIVAQRQKGRALIERIFFLSAFKHKVISQKQLDAMEADFKVARRGGVKLIVRVAYKQSLEGDDVAQDMLSVHLRQVSPLLSRHYPVIFTVQAGFFGVYGDQDSLSSSVQSPDSARHTVLSALLALPSYIPISLRTVAAKKTYFNSPLPTSAFTARHFIKLSSPFSSPSVSATSMAAVANNRARFGYYDQCVGSDTLDAGFVSSLEEWSYLAEDAPHVLVGGQTCSLVQCPKAIHLLRQYNFSYLNGDFSSKSLNEWRKLDCFQSISQSLGYRVSLLAAVMATSGRRDSALPFAFTLINTGFAAPAQSRFLWLVLRKAKHNNAIFKEQGVFHGEDRDKFYTTKFGGASEHRFLLEPCLRRQPRGVLCADYSEEWDARSWGPNELVRLKGAITLPKLMVLGTWNVFLLLPDVSQALRRDPKYMIRFANALLHPSGDSAPSALTELMVDEASGLVDLQLSVNVDWMADDVLLQQQQQQQQQQTFLEFGSDEGETTDDNERE